MKPVRLLASFLVLGIALISAFLIIKNTASKTGDENLAKTSNAPKEIPSFQSLTKKLNLPTDTNSPDTTKNLYVDNEANLTQILSNKAFESLLRENKINNFPNLSIEDITSLISEESLKTIQNFNFSPIITQADIKIDNSISNKDYFYKLKNLSDELFDSNESFNYEGLVNDLKSLSVPKKLSEIHIQLLTLIITEKNMLKAIDNREVDPIKASLAVEKLPKILEEVKILAAVMDKNYSE